MENITAAPCLKKLFIQLNTPLPASAAAERLFSCCGLTMNSRRTRLNDELFEDLVMLKVNKHKYDDYVTCYIYISLHTRTRLKTCFDMI
jgi:hypothetical protein